MAARATNGCSLLRSSAASSPSLPVFRPRRCLHHLRPSVLIASTQRPSTIPRFRPGCLFPGHGGGGTFVRTASAPRLVDLVMEELRELPSIKRVRAAGKTTLLSNKLVEDKLDKQVLQKGILLEFQKDTERILLAVAQKPDGKKNWMVYDQNGVTASIKPQQITYIIPGIKNFDHTQIVGFVQKAYDLLDPSILVCAWAELLEQNKSVTAEELAEIVYGCRESLESYCAHLLLSKDEVYFTVKESKGFSSVYQPRPTIQVEELIQRKHAKEASEKELEDFVRLLMSAKASAANAKPPKYSWTMDEKILCKVQSLEAYAIDACKSDDQKKTAGRILKAMGLPKMSSSAIQLLIDIGYFPVHVNLDLLKFNICTEYPDEIHLASENLLGKSPDPDEKIRKDLTFLKVYAIDVDEADELDDALSAMRLQDGRIRVWIHVADPTCYLQPQDIIDREARRRGTSIFLPTATFPMFPERLAMDGMSLQQGKLSRTVSISVILHPDGSIAEYAIDNSIIRPTYMLTYESATELLHLNLEEEAELKILSEAAALRLQWRCQQGAIDTATIEPRIKVSNPDDPEPSINLYVEDQANPAMRLVSEMMILCGEVVATFGSYNNIPLPYRGQPQSNIPASAFSHLPEGPVRSSAIVKIMRAAEMDFRKPIRHGVLGIPGYVQFTSPIRRYVDLLAHYQVKAFLRGDTSPFSAGQLEGITAVVNIQSRVARRLSNSSMRYWLLEFLRREPRERKFRALVLRFIKDRIASILLLEVGIQASASLSVGIHIGDEIHVTVEEAHPRDDILLIREVDIQ
uniref:Putative ribonuclease sll1290 n=1 Tax=Anthurium amnicola TaxID=1678845 RepID=A0A1D1ZIP0_9ARAE